MNEQIIKELEDKLKISNKQVVSVLKLLEDKCTIPFIARYRKEVTGNLNEEEIKSIEEEYSKSLKLMERKENVIRLIEEKGLLTEEIKSRVLLCNKLSEVEDIYRPFMEKKKTKASEAIKMGLEPLARIIMSFPDCKLEDLTKKFNIDHEVAIENAGYIISEWISDNAFYRKWIRSFIYKNGIIKSKLKKDAVDDNKVYEMYYEFSDYVKTIKHYRVLAINRAENEKVISVKVDYEVDDIISYLEKVIIKGKICPSSDIVKLCIKDSLKRLILPSIEREIRSELTLEAESKAMKTFSSNLESLLLTRPIKGSVVMGFDPAFRTGCKLAIIDTNGNLKEVGVIYPHEPKNDVEGSKKILLNLINKYNVDIIAIGNGTASRESETFVSDCIKGLTVKYILVSEAGASVYSASKLAIEEFPDLTVEKRSAVSIGRRLQDPLSELVKIDPKSIGVGEYQHDVNQKELTENLNFSVSKIVNQVGVNINTASSFILKYVSGLTTRAIKGIIDYKKNNIIKSRDEIKKIVGVTDKIYEQSIGFIRVPVSKNLLDNTGIHPENYEDANKILSYLDLNISDIYNISFKNRLNNVDSLVISKELSINYYVVNDIIKELLNPGLDPRDKLDAPLLRNDILQIEDLKVGMNLEGTVRNVISFGAFVDIGLKNDGLIHISKLSKEFVKDPLDIVSVGDIVKCYVCDIDLNKKKVSLSLIKE